MRNIIMQVESDPLFFTMMENSRRKPDNADVADSITYAATDMSCVLSKVSAIVTYTTSGTTSLLMAKERPALPILALTPNIEVARRMVLVWGVTPIVTKGIGKDFDKVEGAAIKIALENNFAHPGDRLIVTAGYPFGTAGQTNLIQTVHIPE